MVEDQRRRFENLSLMNYRFLNDVELFIINLMSSL